MPFNSTPEPTDAHKIDGFRDFSSPRPDSIVPKNTKLSALTVEHDPWVDILSKVQQGLSKLDSIEVEPKKQTPVRYSQAARAIIEQEINSADLTLTPGTTSFIRLFLNDPISKALRRPLFFSRNIQLLRNAVVNTNEERALRDLLISEQRSEAYRDFSGYDSESKDGGATPSFAEKKAIISANGAWVQNLVEYFTQSNSNFDPLVAELKNEYLHQSKVGWATDPGHGTNFLDLPVELETILMLSNAHALPVLNSPLTFLHIEDNERCIWIELLGEPVGLVPYRPQGRHWAFIHFDGKYYPNAEIALKDLKGEGSWPEVILTDIELGSTIDGLDFIVRLKEIAQDHPMQPWPRIFVYSSNISKYRTRLDGLKRDGIIDEFYDKQNFKVGNFISVLNQK